MINSRDVDTFRQNHSRLAELVLGLSLFSGVCVALHDTPQSHTGTYSHGRVEYQAGAALST
jgi:hypothetical protein